MCRNLWSFLLNVTPEESLRIVERINSGDLSNKPGFVRVSLHPTMTNMELEFIISSLNDITENHDEWSKDYIYDKHTNEFNYKNSTQNIQKIIDNWYKI